jgi:hypothetical protein
LTFCHYDEKNRWIVNMRKIAGLLILAMFLALGLSARAQVNCYLDIDYFSQQPVNTSKIVITPTGYQIYNGGILLGKPLPPYTPANCPTLASGVLTNALLTPGYTYGMTNGDGYLGVSFTIPTNATSPCNLALLIPPNTNYLTGYPPYSPPLDAGTNVVLTTNPTNGHVLVNSTATGGSSTNGLATTNWVWQSFYPTSNPSLFVTASITNGLATTNFVNGATVASSSYSTTSGNSSFATNSGTAIVSQYDLSIVDTNSLTETTFDRSFVWTVDHYAYNPGGHGEMISNVPPYWVYYSSTGGYVWTNYSGLVVGSYGSGDRNVVFNFLNSSITDINIASDGLGNLTATSFTGNGSGLTNVTAQTLVSGVIVTNGTFTNAAYLKDSMGDLMGGGIIQDADGDNMEGGSVSDEAGDSMNSGHIQDVAGDIMGGGTIFDVANDYMGGGYIQDAAGDSLNNGVLKVAHIVSGVTATNLALVGTATLNGVNLLTNAPGLSSSVLPTNNVTDVAPNPGSFVYYKSGTNYTPALNMIYSNMTFYGNSNGVLTPLFNTNGLFASALTGTIPASQLPSGVVTNNNASAVTLTSNLTVNGTISGNGGGLTNFPIQAGVLTNGSYILTGPYSVSFVASAAIPSGVTYKTIGGSGSGSITTGTTQAGFVGILTNVTESLINGTADIGSTTNITINAYINTAVSAACQLVGGTARINNLASTNSGTWSLSNNSMTNLFTWGVSNSAASSTIAGCYLNITYNVLVPTPK